MQTMNWMVAAMLACWGPVLSAQQLTSGVPAGAGQPVNRPGGISYVTRPTPRVTAGMGAASFFGASGVPLNPPVNPAGAAGGVPTISTAAGNPVPVTVPGQLQALAASGNSQARLALRLLRTGAPQPGVARRR